MCETTCYYIVLDLKASKEAETIAILAFKDCRNSLNNIHLEFFNVFCMLSNLEFDKGIFG